MNTKILIFLSAAVLLSSCSKSTKTGAIDKPLNLRCEYLAEPLGIDTQMPRFSWELTSKERGQYQTAYQVLVSDNIESLAGDRGNIWSPGRVISKDNIQVSYSGKPLQPCTKYFWKVRVWDSQNNPSPFSEPAGFETALDGEDWQATWIEDGREAPETEAGMFLDIPCPLFRKEFSVDREIQSARLYISGLGYYEAYLNSSKVGDHMLDPGWTNYARRILYSTYDITGQVRQGENAVGIMLGNGWYNPLPLYLFNRLNLRKVLTIGQPKVIARLRIVYADGTVEWINTDDSWKTGTGPILKNNVYMGEVYDARLEQAGWTEPGFNDSAWKPALPATAPGGKLMSQMEPPIKITREVRPVRITEPQKGVYIFDMGQNFAGVARLTVSGPAGTRVQMRYGELLFKDGTLNDLTTIACHIREGWYYQQREGHPRRADQRDIYILRGDGEETWNPRFTFHGFRYVEVTGYPGKPTLESLTGLRMNAALEDAGRFECSDELFNKIQENTLWTFLSNVFSIESDCPGREKFGYGGDMVTACEAYMYNFNMANFYNKSVRDYRDDQRPSGGMPELAPDNTIYDEGLTKDTGPIGWMLVFPFLQDRLYRYYGDRRLIEEQYDATVRLIEFIKAQAPGYILTTGISDHATIASKPKGVTATAFYYHHVKLLAEFADLLGKKDDHEKYSALAEEIKNAFISEYVRDGRVDIQTMGAQSFALYYDLLPENQKNQAVDVLEQDIVKNNKGHLSTGIFGTKMMYDVFGMIDRNDLGYLITNQKDYPGYGYMIENGGTTIWESWEGGGASYNHPMFGSVSEWFYKSLGGICPEEDANGYDRFIIKPGVVGDLTWVNASYHSVRGRIVSNWELKNDTLYLNCEVPVNTTARIIIPATDTSAVTENNLPLSEAEGIIIKGSYGKYVELQAGSGTYHFITPVAK